MLSAEHRPAQRMKFRAIGQLSIASLPIDKQFHLLCRHVFELFTLSTTKRILLTSLLFIHAHKLTRERWMYGRDDVSSTIFENVILNSSRVSQPNRSHFKSLLAAYLCSCGQLYLRLRLQVGASGRFKVLLFRRILMHHIVRKRAIHTIVQRINGQL